ncbi:MAG: ribosome-associated translation inhibitor RaiA [Clostridia bacterium]|nr:ribosome-associated translation inhibitor RaiA [Clostridia bacterium]
MIFTINGRNVEVTEAMSSKVEEKFAKLQKYFVKEIEANVTFKVEKLDQILEVTIPMKGKILRVEVKDQDMYNTIDLAVDVLEKQLLKYKARLKDHHKKAAAATPFADEFMNGEEDTKEEMKVERRKSVEVSPMTEEEAMLQMELLGHDFFVFLNMETNQVNVVYKRKNDHYGIIEAKM